MNTTVIRILLLVFTGLSVILAPPASAWAAKAEGFISLEDFYSSDSASFDRHFFTSRLRLDATRLNDSGTLGFHFDGRHRLDLASGSPSLGNEARIDALNLEYAGKSFFLSVGRLWPKEMPIETVDGINAALLRSGITFGVFAGFRPNPYTQSTNSDFTTAGAYVNFAGEKGTGGLAYVRNGYKGGTDRQYVYGQGTWMPASWLMAFGTFTTDISPSGDAKLTNGIAELTFRPSDRASITAGYNQFRAFKFYKSSLFAEVEDGMQDAWYLGANYRFPEKYMVYARVERQKRHFPSIEEAFREMISYRAGIINDNLLNTGATLNLSATLTDSFGSKYNAYNAELSKMFHETFNMLVNASYTQNVYGAIAGGNLWAYGASGFYYYKKRWVFSLTADREQGGDFATNRFLTRVTLKF